MEMWEFIMNIAIILLALATIINALHISYIYKELSKRIDREKIYLLNYIHGSVVDINNTNDIKSGKLKKEVKHKKKQD